MMPAAAPDLDQLHASIINMDSVADEGFSLIAVTAKKPFFHFDGIKICLRRRCPGDDQWTFGAAPPNGWAKSLPDRCNEIEGGR